ncbi:hypothetical protein M430DRAFT_277186, partial [Amorphotheca resinae ATCC 22711]
SESQSVVPWHGLIDLLSFPRGPSRYALGPWLAGTRDLSTLGLCQVSTFDGEWVTESLGLLKLIWAQPNVRRLGLVRPQLAGMWPTKRPNAAVLLRNGWRILGGWRSLDVTVMYYIYIYPFIYLQGRFALYRHCIWHRF